MKKNLETNILKFLERFEYEMNMLSTIPKCALTLENVAERMNPLGDDCRELLKIIRKNKNENKKV